MGKMYGSPAGTAIGIQKVSFGNPLGLAKEFNKGYVGDQNGIARLIFGSNLPIGYTKLEYLQSDGTNWINTQVIPVVGSTKLKLKAQFTEINSAAQFLTGSFKSNASVSNFAIYDSSDTHSFCLNLTNGNNYGASDTNVHTYILDSITGKIEFDNSEKTVTNTSLNNLPIILFGRNNDGSKDRLAKAKIYSCKIWENDILIRDFVPCQRDSDQKQGLFDLVNGIFYPFLTKLYLVSETGQNVSGIYKYSSQGYASYNTVDQLSSYLRIRANSANSTTGVAGINRCVTKNSYNVKDYSKITYDFYAYQGGGKVNVTFGYSPYKNPTTTGYTNLYESGNQDSIARNTKSYKINLQDNVYFYFIAKNTYRPDCLTNLFLYKVYLE